MVYIYMSLHWLFDVTTTIPLAMGPELYGVHIYSMILQDRRGKGWDGPKLYRPNSNWSKRFY